MMFVYHYVIIPFHPQYLPRHAPQGAGCQGAGCRESKRPSFLYLHDVEKSANDVTAQVMPLLNMICTQKTNWPEELSFGLLV